MNEECTQKVMEASNRKYSCLQQLLELTKAQSAVINEESMDGLEKIIGEKQVIIDEINKIDTEFEGYFSLLKKKLGVEKLSDIKPSEAEPFAFELKQVTSQIMELLDEMNILEKNNNDKAKALLDDLGLKIRQIRQGKKLGSVYNSASEMVPPAYFVDKKK